MGAMRDADVAVVGAGPAGAAAALFAAQSGLRVIVLDKAAFPRDKPCGEGLMPPGRDVLRRLGLENDLSRIGSPSFHGIAFGLRGQAQTEIPFPKSPFGQLGLGVRRLRFDVLLVKQLRHHPLISFQPEVAVNRVLSSQTSGPTLLTSQGELRAGWIVVADGLRSSLRHQLGWTRGPRPPHRYGIVGHWRADRPLDPWVRITADRGLEMYDGPVGSGERLVAVLCNRARMGEFSGRLADHYRSLVAELRPEAGSPTSEPVAIGPFNYRASTVARDRIFLVGDAAGFVDPISGEGIATGLRQALAFSEALGERRPEAFYRGRHQQLTAGPRRATSLLVSLAASPTRAERAVRGMKRASGLAPKLLGMTLGYWGAGRLSPREWVALLTGR